MRFALVSALAVALALGIAAAPSSSSRGVPPSFEPSSAAAVGKRDLWVLGGGSLLRSTDAGQHFTRVSAPPFPAQGTLPTLEFANARDGFAYVLGQSPLYLTRDGGSTWRRAAPKGDVVAFALGGGNAYLAVGHVLERSPVGRTAWRKLAVRVPKRPVSLAARGSNVWLLGRPRHRPDFDTISVSSDRGGTFDAQKGPCYAELGGTLAPTSGGTIWAVCPSGMMAGLALSKDGGRSFSFRSFHDPGGVDRPALLNSAHIAAASPRVAVLSRGDGGPLLHTADAGRHWSRVSGTAHAQEVLWLSFTTSRVGAALLQESSRGTRLWRTTDGGERWHTVPIR